MSIRTNNIDYEVENEELFTFVENDVNALINPSIYMTLNSENRVNLQGVLANRATST